MHKEQIHGLWQEYRGIYDAPRIYAELRSQGVCIGRHRVARLMREMDIQGKMPRRRRPHTTQTDPSHRAAPNLLPRL